MSLIADRPARSASRGLSAPPLVSVVTPFFNTAPYLRQCIESVLAQTWPRFEYILVDNRSTDGSLEIAKEYAARDQGIRLFTNAEHLPQLDNFNHALRYISPESKYTKVIAADDWLFPECLDRLIQVAEMRESIGLVSSYCLAGDRVWGGGLPHDAVVLPGREVCRRQLLDGYFFFGSLSTVLYRSDLVRARERFFDPTALHADTEVAYETLKHHDFGFVHQVLSCIRVDKESITGQASDLSPVVLYKLIVIVKYGRDCLDPDEWHRCLREHELRYYQKYLHQVFGPRRSRFLARHRPALARVGYRFSGILMSWVVLEELVDMIFNPKQTLGRLLTRLGLRR